MKKSLTILVALSLLLPLSAMAHPGHGPGGPGPGGWGWGPGPGPIDRLPYGVETVLIAGLTYYVVNGIFYQRQNDQYIAVDTPPAATATTQGGMTVLDMNGERFYVKNGFYYKRNINGEYIEVPKPAGL
ncbi:hypothetical protein JHU04_003960 [Brenneria sp. 4F2]|nr:hypothetical protein [Brenneria bubanii]